MAETDSDRERGVQILALFSLLIHAWQRNDFAEAASARDDLAVLGVKVSISPRRGRRGGKDAE